LTENARHYASRRAWEPIAAQHVQIYLQSLGFPTPRAASPIPV
jgi:hypothetical protein